MKTVFLGIILLLVHSLSFAQQSEGVITFERRQYWGKVFSRLSYLSQEEKDRMANTWKHMEEDKSRMTLYFNPVQSLYTYANQDAADEVGGYSNRKDEYVIYRDFGQNRQMDLIETLGKTYTVDDSLRMPTWKILDQVKEVAGYVCMKAITIDPVHDQTIIAWFAPDLPVMAGPERYVGLPGVILELDVNKGELIVEATSVIIRSVQTNLIAPKASGKKITNGMYVNLLKKHIAQSIKDQRNPYWTIRY